MAGDGDITDPQAAGSVAPPAKMPVHIRRTADKGEVLTNCLPLSSMNAALHAHENCLGVVLHAYAIPWVQAVTSAVWHADMRRRWPL